MRCRNFSHHCVKPKRVHFVCVGSIRYIEGAAHFGPCAKVIQPSKPPGEAPPSCLLLEEADRGLAQLWP